MFSHETLKLISHLLQEHINDEKSLESLKNQLSEKNANLRVFFNHMDKDCDGSITLINVKIFICSKKERKIVERHIERIYDSI